MSRLGSTGHTQKHAVDHWDRMWMTHFPFVLWTLAGKPPTI